MENKIHKFLFLLLMFSVFSGFGSDTFDVSRLMIIVTGLFLLFQRKKEVVDTF